MVKRPLPASPNLVSWERAAPRTSADPQGRSLGATEAMNQAESWRVAPYYGQADLEGEHDGREPDEDFEPSLGSSEPIEPEPGATYHGKVREHDESSCARAYDQTHWIPIADRRQGGSVRTAGPSDQVSSLTKPWRREPTS